MNERAVLRELKAGDTGALSEIIGEEVTDDLVDRVFEKFCMGK